MLIESSELIGKLPRVDPNEDDKQISLVGAIADFICLIESCNPVDATQVVRCKDCAKSSECRTPHTEWCTQYRGFVDSEYFCCSAVRKEGE